MRYGVGVHYATPPQPPPPSPSSSSLLLIPSQSPSPASSPSLTSTGTVTHGHGMIFSIFLALFLPCAGMSTVFMVYICLLWYASSNNTRNNTNYRSTAVKTAELKGLSATDLEKLPRTTGKELVLGTECSVCLDEIESEQPARLIPGCNHGFHIQCADTWLSNHSVCPVCRAKLDSEFFNALQTPC
ncbi:hypothetical protein Dsin_003776 [Dipteronia sinensis]|uniref:RING-type E3 ubiquitin transferase n=1 Tax=Dipteronia sinensis TaxID=43782 RepID=A0AAE0EMG6_9ROSI|nr:hypothetical protein Dsin_003776 [Dipteronia sinensis]